ncbi:MAG: hypothetical protein ACLFVZ_05715, partial [Actinomycetota bacterium]
EELDLDRADSATALEDGASFHPSCDHVVDEGARQLVEALFLISAEAAAGLFLIEEVAVPGWVAAICHLPRRLRV